MTGLIVIIITCAVVLSGYLLMPDKTPDANDGAIQIQKKLPGFKVNFLLLRKDFNIPVRNILSKAISGQESRFIKIPVTDYWLHDDTIFYKEYGRSQEIRKTLLVPAVFPIAADGFLQADHGKKYILCDGEVQYLDIHGEVQHTTLSSIQEKFINEHVELRTYFLGTDRAGRDILSRLIFGTRISLSIGFISVMISVFLGLALGSVAGFFGGRIDDFIMWFMSVVWSIPGIILVIAISIALQSRGVWVAFIAVGLTMWVEVARVVRGQIMSIRQKTFIEAARALGIGNFRIIYAHIYPNIIGPVIVIATANFAAAILLEAGLSFLGLSVQPPTPSWGNMIYEGFILLGTKNSWPMVVFPGIAISLTVLSFNLLGNGLRDAIDPKTALK